MNRTVPFKYRGADLTFDLSQGLFSSAGIDVGTRLLLKALSRMFDEDAAAGRPWPARVLDAGCGVGVIGICAASALAGVAGLVVRCQDRDELARVFTSRNAAKNGLSIEARAEPLLAGRADERWDLILSNIPAKAGTPVLEDFARRSAGMLNPGGRVVMVAVRTLAGFFRERIALAGATPLLDLEGSGHVVLAYGPGETQGAAAPVDVGPGFFSRYLFYARGVALDKIEGVPVRIEAVHGAAGFDEAGDAVKVAAKLVAKMGRGGFALGDDAPLLVHEPGQGFFPCWLSVFLHGGGSPGGTPAPVLSGRNVLALEAAKRNVSRLPMRVGAPEALAVPAADLNLGGPALLEAAGGRRYACVVAFPELLPQSSLPKGSDQLVALWGAVPPLLAPGGVFLVVFGSSDAERFDRKKPGGFARLGGIKRNGFRALAYRST